MKDRRTPAAPNTPEYWGALGGSKRASRLTKKQRSESARKAVNARWQKYRDAKGA